MTELEKALLDLIELRHCNAMLLRVLLNEKAENAANLSKKMRDEAPNEDYEIGFAEGERLAYSTVATFVEKYLVRDAKS